MLVKPQTTNLAKIKVVGIGGGGGNAINNMISNYEINGVEFIAINTDAQALNNSNAEVKLRIGEETTRGLGSGGNPEIGKKAAEESVDMIHEHLAGADMIFVTAGMGGGTGTGASPIIAGIAKNLGALTVAIVTKPFTFEGPRRMDAALKGVNDLRDKVDTLIVVPNQKLIDTMERNLTFLEAMKQADDVLSGAVRSIANLITQTGLINVDFADVRTIMSNAGTALMGMGKAKGEDRATQAAKAAISSPLLEVSIDGAKGVLFNIIAGEDLAMYEIDEAAKQISQAVAPEANVIFGAQIDHEKKEDLEITVLATGFESKSTELSGGVIQTRQPKVQMTEEGTKEKKEEKGAGEDAFQTGNFSSSFSDDSGDFKNTALDDDKEEDLDSTPSFLRRKKDY